MGKVVPATAVAIAPQATSDDGMIRLWLDSFRSPATRRGYALDVRAFTRFTQAPLQTITVRHLQEFAATLDHLAAATVARRLSAVKSLIALAHRLGYLQFDVGAPVPLPAIKDKLSERILSEWSVQRWLELERNPRNAVFLRLTYSAGLRISEACTLLWRDVTPRDDGMGQINVFGKGGKTRAILLPVPIWTRLQSIKGSAGPDSPVFRSRNGGCLKLSQAHRIVKKSAKRAGLPPDVSAHWLRHAHVSHSLDRGCPVHIVRATVGHASLETTTRYTHVRPDDSSAKYVVA